MKLLLPISIVERLKRQLKRGRLQEIGGVLVGEHVSSDAFRIADFSVQFSGGTAAHFVRDHVQANAFLADFFQRTGSDYQKFNYVGEWHTHPLFAPLPSGEDCATMLELVHDPAVGVNFAILLIARMRPYTSKIQISATLFRRNASCQDVAVEIENDGPESKSWWKSLLDVLGVR